MCLRCRSEQQPGSQTLALHTEADLVLLLVPTPAAQREAATLKAARPGLLPVLAHSTNSVERTRSQRPSRLPVFRVLPVELALARSRQLQRRRSRLRPSLLEVGPAGLQPRCQ